MKIDREKHGSVRTRSHVRVRTKESFLERKCVILVLVCRTLDETFVQVDARILRHGRTCGDKRGGGEFETNDDKALRKTVRTEKHAPPCPSYTAKKVFPSAAPSSRLRTAVCASSIAAREHVSTISQNHHEALDARRTRSRHTRSTGKSARRASCGREAQARSLLILHPCISDTPK